MSDLSGSIEILKRQPSMFLHPLSIRSATRLAALLLWAGYSASNLANGRSGELLGFANAEVEIVVINRFKYQPDTLAIHVGDIVEWKNIDVVPHTATSVDKRSFDSGRIAKGASWRFRFTRKGTYEYLPALKLVRKQFVPRTVVLNSLSTSFAVYRSESRTEGGRRQESEGICRTQADGSEWSRVLAVSPVEWRLRER